MYLTLINRTGGPYIRDCENEDICINRMTSSFFFTMVPFYTTWGTVILMHMTLQL